MLLTGKKSSFAAFHPPLSLPYTSSNLSPSHSSSSSVPFLPAAYLFVVADSSPARPTSPSHQPVPPARPTCPSHLPTPFPLLLLPLTGSAPAHQSTSQPSCLIISRMW